MSFSIPADEDEVELRRLRARAISMATTKTPEKTAGLISGMQRIFSLRGNDKRPTDIRRPSLQRQTTSFSLYKGLSPSLQSLAKGGERKPTPDRSISAKPMKTSFSVNDGPVYAVEPVVSFRPTFSVTLPDLETEAKQPPKAVRGESTKNVVVRQTSSMYTPQYLEMEDKLQFRPGDPDEKVPADMAEAQPWRPAPAGRVVLLTGVSGTVSRLVPHDAETSYEMREAGRYPSGDGYMMKPYDGSLSVDSGRNQRQTKMLVSHIHCFGSGLDEPLSGACAGCITVVDNLETG